jgi:hypothetical protein
VVYSKLLATTQTSKMSANGFLSLAGWYFLPGVRNIYSQHTRSSEHVLIRISWSLAMFKLHCTQSSFALVIRSPLLARHASFAIDAASTYLLLSYICCTQSTRQTISCDSRATSTKIWALRTMSPRRQCRADSDDCMLLHSKQV